MSDDFKDAGTSLLNFGLSSISQRRADRRQQRYSRNMYALQRADFLSDRDEQRRYDLGYYTRLVSGAKAAGIHPLAALGGGVAVSGGPVFRGDVGSGVGQGTDFNFGRRDRSAEAVNAAQVDNLRANTDYVREQTAASQHARLNQSLQVTKPVLTPRSLSVLQDDKPLEHVVKAPQHTKNRTILGQDVMSNPWFSDAQTEEDRSGEVAAALMGLVNPPLDILYTIHKVLQRKIDDRFGRKLTKEEQRKVEQELLNLKSNKWRFRP